MQVITLGTGSPLPHPERAGPSTLVRAGGLDLLFDCGRGVLMRAAAVMVGAGAIHSLLLTHLHSDHVTDLNDLITSRWALSLAELPFPVYGPPGTARVAERTLAMLEDDIGYRLAHHDDLTWQPRCDVAEVTAAGPEPVVVFDEAGVRVTAAPTEHAPVHPTLGYRVEHEGRSVVIAGDTVPCAGLDALCAGADVYVQTTIRRSLIEAVPLPRLQDILDYHSDIAGAAGTAARAGVATLVLTHPVPAPEPGTEAEWVAEAAGAGFTGTTLVAHDLLTVDV
jgi:ribonuclease Z